jgi:hypothetical protein
MTLIVPISAKLDKFCPRSHNYEVSMKYIRSRERGSVKAYGDLGVGAEAYVGLRSVVHVILACAC